MWKYLYPPPRPDQASECLHYGFAKTLEFWSFLNCREIQRHSRPGLTWLALFSSADVGTSASVLKSFLCPILLSSFLPELAFMEPWSFLTEPLSKQCGLHVLCPFALPSCKFISFDFTTPLLNHLFWLWSSWFLGMLHFSLNVPFPWWVGGPRANIFRAACPDILVKSHRWVLRLPLSSLLQSSSLRLAMSVGPAPRVVSDSVTNPWFCWHGTGAL